MQLGTTMTSDPSVIFHRSTAGGPVTPILSPARQQLRAARGGPGGVLPLLQFDGCPTPTFTVNSSSIPSPHARYYPMCSYAQLDELAAAFASWALLAQRTDGLPTAFSFWPEPGHTLSDKDNTTISENFEGYLDFYVRVAPAVKSATQDNVVAGWQLNAANGNDADPRSTMFWNATQSFLAREAAATGRQRYPIDYFTIQNYQGERSALLLTNSRAALCLAPIAAASGAAAANAEAATEGQEGTAAAVACAERFALTPVIFVRFSENKDVSPNYSHKSGVANLLDELALTASLPDVAFVLHSHWEDFHSPGDASGVSPMVTAVLEFFRSRMPVFRAPVAITATVSGSALAQAAAAAAAGGAAAGEHREDAPGQAPQAVAAAAAAAAAGLAAQNSTTQCFILWSKLSSPLTLDLTIELRRPAAGLRLRPSFSLLTLGPKQSDFFPYRTVALPKPPASQLRIPAVSFVDNGVMAGCIDTVPSFAGSDASAAEEGAQDESKDVKHGGDEQEHKRNDETFAVEQAGAGATGPASATAAAPAGGAAVVPRGRNSALFDILRHDVLVPRGSNHSLPPTGMAHWDSFGRTLTVAVEGCSADDAGLGGVVMRLQQPSASEPSIGTDGSASASIDRGRRSTAGQLDVLLMLHNSVGADAAELRLGAISSSPATLVFVQFCSGKVDTHATAQIATKFTRKFVRCRVRCQVGLPQSEQSAPLTWLGDQSWRWKQQLQHNVMERAVARSSCAMAARASAASAVQAAHFRRIERPAAAGRKSISLSGRDGTRGVGSGGRGHAEAATLGGRAWWGRRRCCSWSRAGCGSPGTGAIKHCIVCDQRFSFDS